MLRLIFICLFIPWLGCAEFYSVELEGIQNPIVEKALKKGLQLYALQNRPPASISALKYRAESDIPEMLKILQAYGYYEARVETFIQEGLKEMRVIVLVHPGPVYKLEDYTVELSCCDRVDIGNIGIFLGKPVISQEILNAELKVLELLSQCGYPLATISKREIVADGESKTVRVHLAVETGPLTRFGPVTIRGLQAVKEEFIHRKIDWCEGDIYDARLVNRSQNSLIDSGLFTSVLISHEEALSPDGSLPMKVELSESKHHSVNVGVSYQTVFGPGVTFGWENRNIAGMGRKLSLQGDITHISHSGIALYQHADFLMIGQDLVTQAQALRENLFAYVDRSYSLLGRIERTFGDQIRFALGVKGERMFVTDSVANGHFSLLEAPIYFRWSTASSPLDPTRGVTLEVSAIPTLSRGAYLIQKFTEATYYPLDKNHRIVLAQKLLIGGTLSTSLNSIPLPKRFLGGSEEDLRGYRYRTVSPLLDGSPEGGRSAIYWSLEARLRITESIGLVPFFDVGSVYLNPYPTFQGPWFKSTGLGLRYFSYFGPFRLDVAFPLDRRKGIDPVYRILVSIGQTF